MVQSVAYDRAGLGLFGWLGWFGLLRPLDLARGISDGLHAQQAAELQAGAALPGFAATEAAQMDSGCDHEQ